ncbi:MAG: acetyl-CoA carboxylase biotin carboxyl carrier protein [Helicobacter sp.]|nr:acetyl-CoA carboxylase biotin carboxyl carrier protein [Helicobacter sp.]
MNFDNVKDLIALFNKSSLSSMRIKNEGFEIKLSKNAPNTANTQKTQNSQNTHTQINEVQAQIPNQAAQSIHNSQGAQGTQKGGDYIISPMVGVFYHKPSPTADPYVKVGDVVKKGQLIGIVEAMKIMNEIEAEFDCKIIAIESTDGQPVEFGSKLMKVEKL